MEDTQEYMKNCAHEWDSFYVCVYCKRTKESVLQQQFAEQLGSKLAKDFGTTISNYTYLYGKFKVAQGRIETLEKTLQEVKDYGDVCADALEAIAKICRETQEELKK
jgi:septation ring formation regulator EzrA